MAQQAGNGERRFRVGVAQHECVVGDLGANLQHVERFVHEAVDRGCDLVVFPELALSGYAVGRKFAEAALLPGCDEARHLADLSRRIGIVVGFIEETEDTEFFNSAMLLEGGQVRHVHRKIYLPNYRTFDERRHFGPGTGVWAVDTPWARIAIIVCGDAWHLSIPYLAAHDGAEVLFVLAASSMEGLTPSVSVREAWERMNQSYALTLSNFVVFANRVGTEVMPDSGTELHFWGGSHVCDPTGHIQDQAAIGTEELLVSELDMRGLRHQRLILPFRRDDSLGFTLDVGRRILRAKQQRRDGFFGVVGRGRQDNGADTRLSPPPAAPDL